MHPAYPLKWMIPLFSCVSKTLHGAAMFVILLVQDELEPKRLCHAGKKSPVL